MGILLKKKKEEWTTGVYNSMDETQMWKMDSKGYVLWFCLSDILERVELYSDRTKISSFRGWR